MQAKTKFNVIKGKKGFVKLDVKRDKRVVFRLTENEELELKERAKSSNLSGSEYIRLLLKLDKK
jgi:predicted DNA binding CopG/RHH family protein